MGIYKAEAVVLRSRVYGEADRILSLFTKEWGKIAAIAKGVRKPTSRLRGAVQLFSHTHLVLYKGKNLDTVTQGETDEDFSFLQDDLDRLATASYCAELVERLTLENQPIPKLFRLLLAALRTLRWGDPVLVARVFEMQLLPILGYRPRLDDCVVCGRKRILGPDSQETGPSWFSIEKGGVICPDCVPGTHGARTVSPAALGAMAYFLRTPLDRAVRVKLTGGCNAEIASLLRSFLAYHGEVKPRTWEFFDDLHNTT
ncbi:MAG TPA: DNA repair protein RecO [Syntrophomonadaceae bacterium]|nr:DNA repair protein RecO [Syntrophomonadaceae bacterium]